MPNLTLTNPTLSDPASKTEVEQNFSDITTAINGALDDTNIASSAGIATSKLAARLYEFTVDLKVQPTTAVAPPTSTTIPIHAVGLPGTTADGTAYTVISATYIITGAGTGSNTTYHVELGYFSAGVWTKVGGNIVNDTNIAGGTETQSGTVTLTTTAITLDASIQYFFGLFLTALGTSSLDGAHQFLDVTLKLKRTSGLR